MLTLISNADIHDPHPQGRGHVLVGGGKILYVGTDRPEVGRSLLEEDVDFGGAALVPGFIDAHVHLTGGGGEGGFSTQVPAVPLGEFTTHGVTSVVGLLGCDDETRTQANLLARTRALREEGLSAWCWTGGYHVPVRTLTGSVRSDITHIDCVIGVGELAISDHRSSQPTLEELARIAADAHVAGMLSGKAGVLHLHLGDGARGLEPVRSLLDTTELPARVFHPTHVNRRKALFEEACELAQRGVTIDLTAADASGDDEWSAEDAWIRFREQDGPPNRLTVSSDCGGCLPVFDQDGRQSSMGVGSSASLPAFLATLLARGFKLEDVLPCMTENVARALRLRGKGVVRIGADADLVGLGPDGEVRHVWANGRPMQRDGRLLRRGTFEN